MNGKEVVEASFGEAATVALLELLLWPLLAAWSGFAVTKLWAWFVVPFFGVKLLTVPLAAVGMLLLVRLFQGARVRSKTVPPGGYFKHLRHWIGGGLAFPAVTLFLGWAVRLWMERP